MKAFVTGGSGFVGRDLLRYLVGDHGDTVVALSRSEKSDHLITDAVARAVDDDHRLSIVRGDVNSSAQLLQEWMKGCDVVYHLASRVLVSPLTDSWALHLKETVEGTRNLVAAAKAANVGKLVFISTIAVFMTGTKGVSDASEDATKSPPSYLFYSKAKTMAEDEALGAATSTFSVVIVRPPMVHGPNDTSILPVIRYYVEVGSMSLATPDGYLVSTLNIRNLSTGIRLAATHGRSGQAYHFQDRESPMPARDFFSTYASCVPGLKVQVAEMVAAGPSSPTPRWILANLVAWLPLCWKSCFIHKLYASRVLLLTFNYPLNFSSARTEQELGYEPLVSFQDSMRLTADSLASTLSTQSAPLLLH